MVQSHTVRTESGVTLAGGSQSLLRATLLRSPWSRAHPPPPVAELRPPPQPSGSRAHTRHCAALSLARLGVRHLAVGLTLPASNTSVSLWTQ